VKAKKLPAQDLVRILSIITKLSNYYPDPESVPDEKLVPGFRTNHEKFLFELIGRIRHSVFEIPKEYFTLTMANLVEYQQFLITYNETGFKETEGATNLPS
jgi:hypothetical protein